MNRFILIFLFMAVLVLPAVTVAATPSSVDDLVGILGKIFDIFYKVFFAVAAFAIVYAAYLFIFSVGDPQKVDQARKMLIYSVIAIFVGLIALSIDDIIASFIGGI